MSSNLTFADTKEIQIQRVLNTLRKPVSEDALRNSKFRFQRQSELRNAASCSNPVAGCISEGKLEVQKQFFSRSCVKFNDPLRSGLVGVGPRSASFFHLLRCIHDEGYSACLVGTISAR